MSKFGVMLLILVLFKNHFENRVDDLRTLFLRKKIDILAKFGISGKSNTPIRSTQESKPLTRIKTNTA